MQRTLSIGLLVILALVALQTEAAKLRTAKPESVGMSSERLERIGIAMRKHIDAGDIQGAVTAVARRGRVVHFETHGLMDVEAKRPMDKDAIFIMMSSTKPVLAVAAMMMIEEGLIRPTDLVSKYIPEFKDMQVAVLAEPTDEDISPRTVDRSNPPPHRAVPAERPVTISDLLTHTSGLRSGGLGAAVSTPAERDTLASYIPTLGKVPPYDQFVRTRIFEPLGMKDTHYNLPPEKESRRVIITGRDMSRFQGQTTAYFSGSYGLSSTAEDYLRFEQMLVGGGALHGKRLLSPRSVTMMGSNHLGDLYRGFTGTDKGVGYGYAVSVVTDPIAAGSRRSVGAFGWGGAFGTRSWTDPAEELTAVIMIQQPHRDTQYDFDNAVQQAIID